MSKSVNFNAVAALDAVDEAGARDAPGITHLSDKLQAFSALIFTA
jgi:hypothetical protein